MSQDMDQALADFKDMLERENEPLHPDLEPYMENMSGGLRMLRHPLVYQVPFWNNGSANFQYEHKKKAVEQALDDRNYSRVVFLHERPYRLEAFINIQRKLSNEQYAELLADIWIDTENQHAYLQEWKMLLSASRLRREYMMTDEDKEALKALPTLVTVYRGCQRGLNENGLSWTLDKDKAEFFAHRFRQQGIILERQVRKTDIVALLTGRGENEVILL